MVRLNYTVDDELAEYNLIVLAKREPSRTALRNLEDDVTAHYHDYIANSSEINFNPANPFDADQSTLLRNCYNSPTAPLEKLKARIIGDQADIFKSLCPYCLLITHSTFDHYVPKEQHPVFSVLAKNLIPCCWPCNNYKLEYWQENGERAIIHFYNDDAPEYRFLHCTLEFNGLIPVLSFNLAFPAHAPEPQKTRVENHFKRLHLLTRYNKDVPKILSDIHTDVQAQPDGVTAAEIAALLHRKANIMYQKYGHNFWYATAYECLGQSPQYVNSLIAPLP